MDSHRDLKLFKCDECEKSFNLKSTLNKHKRSHLKNPDDRFVHVIDFLFNYLSTYFQLIMHLDIFHNVKNCFKWTYPNFFCTLIAKRFLVLAQQNKMIVIIIFIIIIFLVFKRYDLYFSYGH